MRIALPLTVVALWLVPMLGLEATVLSGPCAIGGYTAATILIMALCSNMCYRHGVSAIWLFGIERSLRLGFMFLGRGAAFVGIHADLNGIDGDFLISGSGKSRADKQAQRVADRCGELAAEYHLTARELEILRLLAQRKTVGMIERDLFIANGTAKAHVRHIYQKLDIHSREELFALLDPAPLDPLESDR